MNEDGLIRVMALNALSYCERLFYLEEVEGIEVANEAVYAGRALHETLEQTGEAKGQWRTIEFSDEELGLVGRTDCLCYRDGALIPYEHKRGRPRWEGGEAAAWPGDALQVSAYGMLLEREMGCPVPEGRIRYHKAGVTVRVPLDGEARRWVREAVERARRLRASLERPPVAEDERRCIKCSLAPVCLPEEERLAGDPEWLAVRLFPPEEERRTIYVMEPGARVSRWGETLCVKVPDGEASSFPVREVGAVVLHGYPQITTQALHLCIRRGVALHWLTPGGRYVTGLAGEVGDVQRRIRQYRALSDPGTCLRLARKL
ncbi:MAG: CRISPR-associated protein Cas4, partial [Deltaproteobacteria bacterium]